MAGTIATIGSLVQITSTLIDVISKMSTFWGLAKDKEKVQKNFKEFYNRMDVLSLQLEQCEDLTKKVPAWQFSARLIWDDLMHLPSENVDSQALYLSYKKIGELVDHSKGDYFSYEFYMKKYDMLPHEVQFGLEDFTRQVDKLYQTLQTIERGKANVDQSRKDFWPQVKDEFTDAQDAANRIGDVVNTVRGKLIMELRDSAKEGLSRI